MRAQTFGFNKLQAFLKSNQRMYRTSKWLMGKKLIKQKLRKKQTFWHTFRGIPRAIIISSLENDRNNNASFSNFHRK